MRLGLLTSFDVRWGYDAESHMANVWWFVHHEGRPSLDENRVAYHPPAFYALAEFVVRQLDLPLEPPDVLEPGAEVPKGWRQVQALAVALAMARLVVFWVAVRLLITGAVARIFALLLACLLPVSLHLDAMLSNESLHVLLSWVSLLTAILLVRTNSPKHVWLFALLLGVSMAGAILAKVSALTIFGAVLFGLVCDLLRPSAGDPVPVRTRRLSYAASVVLCASLSAPYFVGNVALYGKPIVSGFDRAGADRDQYLGSELTNRPYHQRRPLAYFKPWASEVLQRPYWPSSNLDAPRALPVLVASTFVDYYNYGFARFKLAGRNASDLEVNGWPLRPAALASARISVLGGATIALLVTLAWVVAARRVWKERTSWAVAPLLAPLLALVGQLHFAIVFPVDAQGVIKGAYMQYAAAPLFVLFGLSLQFLWRGSGRRILWGVAVLALAAVVFYVFVSFLIARGYPTAFHWTG